MLDESHLLLAMCLLLCAGRGMPDVASRAFLASLVKASRQWGTAAAAAGGGLGGSCASQAGSQRQPPALPVLGLVDWNPGGVSILLAYKYGCAALGLESAR
jgi:DNA topoisomerase VI subunit A